MPYLVGTFNREHFDNFDFSKNENPLLHVGLTEVISKSHLISAKNDENYQIINLETMEYYNPDKNIWTKIQTF